MDKIEKSRFEWVGSDPENREGISRPSITYWRDAINRLSKNKVAVACFFLICIIILSCIVVPFFMPFESREQHTPEKNSPLFTACTAEGHEGHMHIFGTDSLGRDLFTRAFEGGRVSIIIAFAAVAVNLLIGMVYGGISGYIGGTVDNIMMRIVEIINGIPYLIIVILLMMVMPRGIGTLIVAFGITSWTGMARLVRGQILQLKSQEFIVAAEAMGAKRSRIIARHLIPNALSVIIVNITMAIPSAIFAEAFLSYLGLGVPIPQTSWGVLAQEGQAHFMVYPYQLIIPAAFISLTMLSFNLLGDGLRDAFDPRLRR